MPKYLVTGTAGFIGFHLANALLAKGNEVVGLDNINDYYDVRLKYARLKEAGIISGHIYYNALIPSSKWAKYSFVKMNLEDKDSLMRLFRDEKFEFVVHLAAQAGVRHSIDNPDVYIHSNIDGFFNVLEACRHYPVQYLLYASSSSVYGNIEKVPFNENDNVDRPISLYAATKRSNELMAYTYKHLYQLKSTGLRFFTVYGPWGRPDMAIYKFTDAILAGKPLTVYAEGLLMRDFTFIDDIVNGICKILELYRSAQVPGLMNIGHNKPVSVKILIDEIERSLRKQAIIEYLPMQPGDVNMTYADIELIEQYSGFVPQTDLKDGIDKFCEWYLEFNSYRNSSS